MRALLHGDVTAAARAILLVPDAARRGLCRRMIREAHFAHAYMKRTGRAHRLWGNGSLLGAASLRPMAVEPRLGDAEYCACLEMVFHEIVLWRQRVSGQTRN